MAIFIELILPASDNGRDDHLVKSCLVLSSSILKLFLKRSLNLSITCTPRYLKESYGILKGNMSRGLCFAATIIGKISSKVHFVIRNYPKFSDKV